MEVRRVLSLPEVATALGVARTTPWRWVEAGRLGAFRIGGRWAVPDTALEAFRLQRQQGDVDDK